MTPGARGELFRLWNLALGYKAPVFLLIAATYRPSRTTRKCVRREEKKKEAFGIIYIFSLYRERNFTGFGNFLFFHVERRGVFNSPWASTLLFRIFFILFFCSKSVCEGQPAARGGTQDEDASLDNRDVRWRVIREFPLSHIHFVTHSLKFCTH